MSDNRIQQVTGLSCLPTLFRLSLDNNLLQSFPSVEGSLSTLEMLSLRGNQLPSFDAACLHGLRSLNLDDNVLEDVYGLEHLPSLDLLSARAQHGADSGHSLASSILSQKMHARQVYLSKNSVKTVELSRHHHGIGVLDLSSCGLSDLPIEFGLHFPNLHKLNLNFNALKDVRPLLNIRGVAELHVAANRISSFRKSAIALGRLASLSVLDMRDNTLTLGFYPPTVAKSANLQLTVSKNDESVDLRASPETCSLRKWRSNLIAKADLDADKEYLKILDGETKLARTVNKVLIADVCTKLKELDGLPLVRERSAEEERIWHRLRKIGVL